MLIAGRTWDWRHLQTFEQSVAGFPCGRVWGGRREAREGLPHLFR